MAKTFDEKFGGTIEEMKKYLIKDHLSSISMTFTDNWTFKLSIPKSKLKTK